MLSRCCPHFEDVLSMFSLRSLRFGIGRFTTEAEVAHGSVEFTESLSTTEDNTVNDVVREALAWHAMAVMT